MKRTRYISLIIALLSVLNITAQQQQSQYALYNYRNDGDFNAWLNIDVDSITYSNIGIDSIEYDNLVTQEVWTPDSCYRIPIEAIDSIGFRAPKPIMRGGLFYLRDYHATFTNSIDSLTIYFNNSILNDSLPSVGQPILCATKMTPYEDGFAGKVVEIKNTSEGIAVICEEIGIADIFQQLVLVGKVLSEQPHDEPKDSRKKTSDPWINLEESDVKLKELKPISFDLFDGLIEVTSPRPRLICSYYIYVSEVYYEIFAKVDLQHRDLTYKLTLSTDQLKDLEDYGSFFKALATDNIDEWLNEKMNKSVKKYIEEQKYEDKLAEANIAEKIWKTKKWDIPIIEDGVLNLTLTVAPLFKTKGSISAVTEFKTDAMQSMRIKVSGITPLAKYTSKINDAKASFHQDPIKSTTLDIQAKGSVTLGFTALLNVNVVHRNVLYAGIGGEFGVDFTGIINATIIDTEQPDMNMYDRLKDTRLKISEYGKWYLEAGVSPLDIFHLRGPKWDLFSPFEQIYYLMPQFTEPQMPKFGERTWLGKDPLSFYTYPLKDVFIPCRIGMRITDEEGNVKKEYINDNEKYVWEKDWLNRYMKIDVSNLPAGASYRCYPVMSFLNGTVFNAGPHHDFYVPLPMVASPSELTLAVGDTADVQYFGGWDTFAVVMEEGEDVASIVQNGEPRLIRVKGNKVGTASLKIEDRRSGQVVHVPITVKESMTLTLSEQTVSLQEEESTTVLVLAGSGNYTAESSNKNVATATVENDTITITAISIGSAVITVTDAEAEETATIEVTVKEAGSGEVGVFEVGLPPSTTLSPEIQWEADMMVFNNGEVYNNDAHNQVIGTPPSDIYGNKWYAQNYQLTNGEETWNVGKAPFSSDATYSGKPSTQWTTHGIMADIYLRRTFIVNGELSDKILFSCCHDDAPAEWYLNGVLIRSIDDGWNYDDKVYLTPERCALIHTDGTKNVLAIHVHNNWGGAFADGGLYDEGKSPLEIGLPPSTTVSPDVQWKADMMIFNNGEKYYEDAHNQVIGTPPSDIYGNEWYARNYQLTDGLESWSIGKAPFASNTTYNGKPSTQWTTAGVMADIYLRRTFVVDHELSDQILFSCGHDDAPAEWYLNGVLIRSIDDGWNNNDQTFLTPEQCALIYTDGTKNVLAIHIHNNYGDAFADGGLYEKPSLKKAINEILDNMVYVSGGTFMMGATEEQANYAFDEEKPAHQVTVPSFYINRYEVTQAQWEAVMGYNNSQIKGDRHPVEHFTYSECQTFIDRLSELTGKKFRLPTEAEWEYAARGGNKSRGYKYAGSNNIDDVAWYGDGDYYGSNGGGNSGSTHHKVGLKKPNELGLYDMTGNVWEHTSDNYYPYEDGAVYNPKHEGGSTARIDRGGSFGWQPRYCRLSFRDNTIAPYGQCGDNGFRLVLDTSEFSSGSGAGGGGGSSW